MKVKDAAIAAEELDDALTYYRDVHPDFAEALFNEVSRAKKLIVQFPFAWKNMVAVCTDSSCVDIRTPSFIA